MSYRMWAFVIGCVLATSAHAQFSEPDVTGKLYTRVEGRQVKVAIRLLVSALPKAHLFGIQAKSTEDAPLSPLVIALTGTGVVWKPIVEPPTALYEGAAVHYGQVDLFALGELAPDAPAPTDVSAKLNGQYCSEGVGGSCYTLDLKLASAGPGDDALFAKFPGPEAFAPTAPADGSGAGSGVAAGSGSATAPAAGSDPATPVGPGTASVAAPSAAPAGAPAAPTADETLVAFLLTAVGAGLLALVMPCTYPMIPITISFFTKQAESRGGFVLPLSLTYGAGIILMFVGIGLVVGPAIIDLANSWQLNLGFAVLFILFGLSLFGCYDLNPPSWLLSASVNASSKGGYLGVFVMGATLVITSFTCTAPFVGTLLSIGSQQVGSQQGDHFQIALGMAVFGLTMAVPFVVLSMVPGRLKALPRSGQWMNTFKVSLGFVEIAAALKFLSNVDLALDLGMLPRELFLLVWVGIFAVLAAYLLGAIDLKGSAASVGPWRMTTGLVTALFALYCMYGFMGHPIDRVMLALAPQYRSSPDVAIGGSDGKTQAGAPREHTIVVDDFDRAVELAKSRDAVLLVNFTGLVCTNCRQVEEHVFRKPELAALLTREVVEARLHNDRVGPHQERILALQAQFVGTRATPSYVTLDPAAPTAPIGIRRGWQDDATFTALVGEARQRIAGSRAGH